MVNSSLPGSARRRLFARIDRFARALVQVGFLILFLYPLAPLFYQRVTYQPAPVLTSWLFPWDGLVQSGNLLNGKWGILVLGAPLLLLAISFVFGRIFCGWVCPLGTVFDGISALAFWRKRRGYIRRKRIRQAKSTSTSRNSLVRYSLLIGVGIGSLLSVRWLGVLDPLVIFNRVSVSLTTNLFSLQQPPERIFLSGISLLFFVLAGLELWRPRFWCRNLCPFGALLGLAARFSLFNRRVSTACTGCAECSRVCPMNAIPAEAHDTDYSDCTFCLECQADCPKGGITFGFGGLALRKWQPEPRATAAASNFREGQYRSVDTAVLSRRQMINRTVIAGTSGLMGLAATPLALLSGSRAVLRPPGALSEEDFLRACILCQECVRVCPTGGLKPAFLESGFAGIGTPMLLPRQGGCALNPSCPNLCAQVCPVGALRPTRPEELKIGLAHVHRDLCLAWDQGGKCLVCVEACLNHAAIPYHGRVTVDALKCTGCGRCESGCPVAGSAIRVYPRS